MASIVALKQFSVAAGGVSFTVRPGDVFVSTDFSSTDYATLVAAGAAQNGGNGFVSFDSPGAGLTAARAAVVALRSNGGLDPDGGNGTIVMLDGYLADADGRAVSTGTAVLAESMVNVTVPAPPGDEVPVPVGALVYATMDVVGGIPKVLSAYRLNDTQIHIESPGLGYGPLLEVNGADGTLVGGTIDIVMANVPDDRLSVILMNDNGGTPGVLSVKRKNAIEVTVESWLAGAGIQVLDVSDVRVYDFGQPFQDTSTVRWAVVRP